MRNIRNLIIKYILALTIVISSVGNISFMSVNANDRLAFSDGFQTNSVGTVPVHYSDARDSTMLKDIEIDGRGIYGFNGEEENYIIDIPYNYTVNNFENFPVPEIKATAVDPESKIRIEYPETVNGGVVTIMVTSSDNTVSKTYNLNLRPIGVNLYKDGGFENSAVDLWTGYLVSFSEENTEKLGGNKSMRVYNHDAGSYAYQNNVLLFPDKTYIASWAIKNAPGNSTVYSSFEFNWRGEYNEDGLCRRYTVDGVRSGFMSNLENGWKKSLVVFRTDNSRFNGNATMNSKFSYCNWASDTSFFVDEAYLSELIVADVRIDASKSEITKPLNESKTIALSAQMLNQFGNSAGLEEEKVDNWRIKGNPVGVSIDRKTGDISITSNAQEGMFTVEAVVEPELNNNQQTIVKRHNISVLPYVGDNLKLADIEIDGRGIYDFDGDKRNYTVDLIDDTIVPNVIAKPVDSESKVNIQYPQTTDGEIVITVTDAINSASNIYRLTLRPVGEVSGEVIIADVNMSPSKNTVEIPSYGTETVRLTTKLLNQFGNSNGLEAEKVDKFRVIGSPAGVTVSSDGIVTVGSDAHPGLITVEAQTQRWHGSVQSGVTGRIQLSLVKNNVNSVCFSDNFEEETVGSKPAKWDDERFGVATFTVESENLPNGSTNKFARIKMVDTMQSKGAVVATEDGQVNVPMWENDKNIVIETKLRSSGTNYAKTIRAGYPKDSSFEDYGSTKYAMISLFRNDGSIRAINGAFYQGRPDEQTKLEKAGGDELELDKWYDVKIIIYPKSKTAEFYVDGKLITIGGKRQGYISSQDFVSLQAITNLTFKLNIHTYSSTAETMDFDDVKVYCVSDTLGSKILTKNGGFEYSVPNGMKITSDEAHSGEYCAYVSSREDEDDVYTQEITLMPNKTYIASSYVRTRNGTEDTFTVGVGDKIEKPYRDIEENICVSDEWTNVNLTFNTENHSNNIKIYPAVLPSLSSTEFYIDDFYVGELCIEKGEISGDSTVFIPVSGSNTKQYSVNLFNQFGSNAGLYDEKPYKWEIITESKGATIDNDGLLSVPSDAHMGEITLKAYLKPSYIGSNDNELVYTYNVNLAKCDVNICFKKDEQKLFGIENGAIITEFDFFNGDKPKKLSVTTVLYEKKDNEYIIKEVSNEGQIPIYSGENLIYKTPAINVTDAKNQIIKAFVWDETLNPIAAYELLSATGMRDAFYISTDGSDSNDGTKESPFATLEAARDAIRKMKSTCGLPDGGVNVFIRGGKYFRDTPFELTAEDSGTSASPVRYMAYPEEKPIFIGGIQLLSDTFDPISDNSVKDRIIEKTAIENIIEVDLSQYGITHIDETNYIGNYVLPWIERKSPAPEFFVEDASMHLARYPNDDFLSIEDIVYEGSKNPWQGNASDYQNDGFVITYYDERMDNWENAEDLRLFGYWYHFWADQSVSVRDIDTVANTIKSAMPSYYGIRKGQKYYAYNLIEELDAPGEYYIDRESKNKKLYFYPPENFNDNSVYLSVFDGNMVNITEASNITLSGLRFTACRGKGINTKSVNNVRIINCELENTGSTAIYLSGYNNIVEDCSLHDVNGGITVIGGEQKGLIPGNNLISNNEIERFDRLQKTYNAAVNVNGVGNKIIHNRIHDAQHLAIIFSGNDHVFEYNEIYDVCRLGEDSAAVYSGGSWAARGNRIAYNYIHDIYSPFVKSIGVFGVYLDDQFSGTLIEGNVFENIDSKADSSAVYINGGKDNSICNNIFINCADVCFNVGDTMDFGDTDRFVAELNKLCYTDEPWRTKYPELYSLLDNPEYYKSLGNVVYNNLGYNSQKGRVSAFYDGLMKFAGNVRYDEGDDPGFVNLEDRNYSLKPDADIFNKNSQFRQVPFGSIGIK